ncbi:NAD(P)-binding protein [Aspergillus karnatakaensis]|uniref:NAD(P)-dependent oxidoreductase n=1 Tax=Aspergillus karnatakaensis TaxID=1810916 RepID=UPI003CCCBD42
MRIIVIGGTGRCGRLVIDELLARNHDVTALARNPSALGGDPRAGLTVFKGTPTSLADLRTTFTPPHTPDVVIVTLASTRASDSPFAAPTTPPDFMTVCNKNILACMAEFGVSKTVILQAFGVGESWKNMSCALQLLMKKSNMWYTYEDHNAVERIVRDAGVRFVFVRPGRLVEGSRGDGTEEEEVRIWKDDGKGVPLMASTTRGSVASFLVKAALGDEWDGEGVVITN